MRSGGPISCWPSSAASATSTRRRRATRCGRSPGSNRRSDEFVDGFGQLPLRFRQPRAERVGGPIADVGDPSGAGDRGDRPDAAGADQGCSRRPVRGARPPAPGGRGGAARPGQRRHRGAAISWRPRSAARRRGCPGRERTKTNCIRLIHEMRMSMREIGRRMVERGAFDEIEDFGFVRAAEIDVLLDGDASTLTAADPRASRRVPARSRRRCRRSCSSAPPTGRTPGRCAVRRRSSTSRPARSCAGSRDAPAWPRDRARVILDPNDPCALGPGDVLVAPITDPSWTPLFVPAAASSSTSAPR